MSLGRVFRARARGMTFAGAVVLIVGATLFNIVADRARSLSDAGQATAAAASAVSSYGRLVLGTAMRRLEDFASADQGGSSIALRQLLASVPGAQFVAVLDSGGRLLDSAGSALPPELRAAADLPATLARSSTPWYFFGNGTLMLAHRIGNAAGRSDGVVVLGTPAGWIERFLAGNELSGEASMMLLDQAGRVILRVPGPVSPAPLLADEPLSARKAAAAPAFVERREIVPGQLTLQLERGVGSTLNAWLARSAARLLGCAAVLGLLLAGGMQIREHLRSLQRESLRHVRRLAQLATACERLSRLRDIDEIVRRAESLGPGLLGCDSVEVQLGASGEIASPIEPEQLSVNLLGAEGNRLGRLVVRRRDNRARAEDELILDQFARAVAATLESATRLADTVRAKSELELILATISDGMLVLDRSWQIRFANAAAARYLQCQPDEMPGVNLWSLLPSLRDSEFGEQLEAAAGQGHDAVFTCRYAPLKAWYDVRAYPFVNGLTIYFRDITKQRETEEKLRQAQKLEAVGQLTGGIAHDVNNLLTVILGNLEMLAMRAEDRLNEVANAEPEPELDFALAEAGLRAGESASQLMHRLLAFSRRQPLEPKTVDVGALLQNLQPLLRRTLREQVQLRVAWPEDLWPALVNPAELESAVLNLAINAQDAMPTGGHLSIDAANIGIDRVYAAVAGLERTGDYIMITVADSGTGMDAEVLARAFDPFFTTKPAGRGSGLGLSMVYGFAHQSGGHVLIDSEPGQGTVVRIYLPRAASGEGSEADPERTEVAGGNEKILLVEDNELVRAHTEAMLRGLGYDVTGASDATIALRALADGLRPDMLVTDVILPGNLTGRDVAEQAQLALPGLPVLFISGYSGSVLLENGRLPPGVELLGKPFRRSELAARIRAQLAAPRQSVCTPTDGAGFG